MSRFVACLLVVLGLLAFDPSLACGKERPRELSVIWCRLVDAAGKTCPRCSETGEEVVKAVARVRQAFRPLGVDVKLRAVSITQAEFEKVPLASNRILVNGKSVEAWIGGTIGKSPCCASCGTNECRTMKVDGKVYEAIPEWLIVKACLLALAAEY